VELFSALIGGLLLYFLQDYLYKNYWKRKLNVDISFSRDSAVEGEGLSLVETITNRKLLPLPLLQVKFMASRFLEFADSDNSQVSDNYYRNDIVSVMMYQKLTKTLDFTCTQRGYYTINRMDIVCSNLFMTTQEVEAFDLNIYLYVYPKPVDLLKLDISFSKMLGTILTRRFINEDPFEFHNIREYQLFDNLKSINWKASAKTDSLKVNVHDYTSSQQVKIIINTQPETIWKYDELSEESIRIAASLAHYLIEKGIPVSVYTNARDIITKESIEIPAGSGHNHFKMIQEALSRIELAEEPHTFIQGFSERLTAITRNDYLILISYNQKEELQRLMLGQILAKKDFVWIIPTNNDIKVTVCDELSDRIIQWELG
jgi:uncharacterized protein (DUF58 family)